MEHTAHKPAQHKERIITVIEDEWFVGRSLNFPQLIVQARSEEELKTRMKALFRVMVQDIQRTILEEEDPFELEMRDNPFTQKNSQ